MQEVGLATSIISMFVIWISMLCFFQANLLSLTPMLQSPSILLGHTFDLFHNLIEPEYLQRAQRDGDCD